jgi:hypothetical protein
MQYWVDLYARDYGGLGVVLAIYFWIAFSSAVSSARRASRLRSPSGAAFVPRSRYLSRRDSRRSLRTRPPVWQAGQ